MSFVKKELQTVQCDNCGVNYQDEDTGYAFWMDAGSAWEAANNDGWTYEDDKHYCSNCHYYTVNDDLVLKDIEKSIIINS